MAGDEGGAGEPDAVADRDFRAARDRGAGWPAEHPGGQDDGVEEPGVAGLSAPHTGRRRANREHLSGWHQHRAGCGVRSPPALSLEEAGDRLFTFTRLPPSQWRSARTTNAIERLHEEFKRRIKTQTVLPSADTAAMLFWAAFRTPAPFKTWVEPLQKATITAEGQAPHPRISCLAKRSSAGEWSSWDSGSIGGCCSNHSSCLWPARPLTRNNAPGSRMFAPGHRSIRTTASCRIYCAARA